MAKPNPAAASRTVFLVAAFYDHEPTVPLRAFLKSSRAETFRKECQDYRAQRPVCPASVEDTQENDRLWDRWFRSDAKFRRKHLAGEHAGCDTFGVVEVPLDEVQT